MEEGLESLFDGIDHCSAKGMQAECSGTASSKYHAICRVLSRSGLIAVESLSGKRSHSSGMHTFVYPVISTVFVDAPARVWLESGAKRSKRREGWPEATISNRCQSVNWKSLTVSSLPSNLLVFYIFHLSPPLPLPLQPFSIFTGALAPYYSSRESNLHDARNPTPAANQFIREYSDRVAGESEL